MRQLIIVLRPTSADDCLYAEGFTVTYREYGRLISVHSDGVPMIYYYLPELDTSQCSPIVDEIFAHQRQRRGE
jgi:hypothetical protein